MGRPCSVETVQFRRKLTEGDRAILLASGHGDITEGFHRVLEVARHLHGLGFQHGDPIECISFVTNDSHLDLASE